MPQLSLNHIYWFSIWLALHGLVALFLAWRYAYSEKDKARMITYVKAHKAQLILVGVAVLALAPKFALR